MKQLKLTTKTVQLVDWAEFDLFIREIYDLTRDQYSVVSDYELSNGSYVMFSVKPAELSSYDLRQIESVKSGKCPLFCTEVLLTDLCNKGWLDPGDYVIQVSW